MRPGLEEIDVERARAAVAVACLRWLGCTGPTSREEIPRTEPRIPDLVPIRFLPPGPEPEPPHPLWDRWLDSTA